MLAVCTDNHTGYWTLNQLEIWKEYTITDFKDIEIPNYKGKKKVGETIYNTVKINWLWFNKDRFAISEVKANDWNIEDAVF